MKINHNMSAMVANKRLLNSESSLSKSIERLSTGLRINRASDDAAGMAIASKMRTQIKGLNQASRNSSDGISVLETADGALSEVHNMLQRMRELSVQAANGTNTPEDLKAIQAEISSLREEIDRVSRDTEFNTKNLLDGTLDQRVYPDNRGITRVDISSAVNPDTYTVEVTGDAEHAVIEGGAALSATDEVPAGAAGKVIINGSEAHIQEGDSLETVYQKLRDAAELGEANLLIVEDLTVRDGLPENEGYVPGNVLDGGNLVFVSAEYGNNTELNIKCDNPDLASFLGLSSDQTEVGKDVEVAISAEDEGFGTQATVLTEGNTVTITDRSGFEMKFQVEPRTEGEVNIEVANLGPMTLQIGANENQTMDVRIREISSETLYIDKVNVCTVTGASRAITRFDEAIAKVSEVRSSIGAYQNRLDYTVASLDGTEENMTQALSRIEDVDMAEEMTEYTKDNILTQAATSVLAQANDLPQQVLQLLQ